MALRFIKQLDGSRYAGANCGPVSTAHALAWSTRGALERSGAAMRELLGGQWSGPGEATSLSDQRRAWEASRRSAKRRGLELPEYDRRVAADSSGIREALDRGHGVVVQVDHRTLNQRRPDLSGDRGFNGLHVVFVPRLRVRSPVGAEVLVYDGLCDGRTRGGHTYPRGPQWWPMHLLIRCAEDRVRRDIPGALDRSTYAVIRRATPIEAPPEPTPEPPATCEAKVAILAERNTTLARLLSLAEAERDAARSRRDDLEVALMSAATALRGTAEQIDAALADIAEVLPPPIDGGEPSDGVGAEQ